MLAVTEPDTHTITVMTATQMLKTELLLNIACYHIHQDPGSILFVQPTQNAARDFSKERFQPTVEAMPELAALVPRPKTGGSENTIVHKAYPGGTIDFVGSNSPTDLASRPKRIGLFDEIDKYPPSAGEEGDPLKLGEERLSTYRAVGRSKSVRTCSPTDEDTSRIGREYRASDQRRCFVPCPHCGFRQLLTWAQVQWGKNVAGEHLPDTAGIMCSGPGCGVIWTESERLDALASLASLPDRGWRQTRQFVCCETLQVPEVWDDHGRSLCGQCGQRAPYDGHAGFHVSKLHSRRHRLHHLVREFLEAKDEPELLKKFTNTGLAELWRPQGREGMRGDGLIARAELYGPDDLPDEIRVITGFCDVQGDRLEVQLIGWGQDEEAWPFLYEIIHDDPAQPAAWQRLDEVRCREFRTRAGRVLRVSAFGIDTGGHHGAQVYAYCRQRRHQRLFACKGAATGPLWTGRATRSKNNDPLWIIGTNAAKDTIYARLRIEPPEPDKRRPGYIHFPRADNFGPEYYEQLTSERRETRKRSGVPYTVWMLPDGKRNEALDTFVGALAVRRSLPRLIQRSLEFKVKPPEPLPEEPEAELEPLQLVKGPSAEPVPAAPAPAVIKTVTIKTIDQPQRRSLASMLAR